MILSAVLMIDWLNCTEVGTSDSLSSSDDRLVELYGGRYQLFSQQF